MPRLPLPLAVSLILPVVARDVFDWDLGWRFAFQAPTSQQACNASSFPVDASGKQCFGLTPIYGVSTPEGCVQAACDAGGVMWQLGSKVAPPAASCWVGTPAPQPCAPAAGAWVGGASAAPPPAFPFDVAPAAPAFNDSLWAVTDAPHDALIAQNYSEAQNNGQGNLPKQRLWYRKRFTLPAEWSGSHVSIYFEGVFSVATVFLNGLPLLTHASGYTSFAAVLHNASSVRWGAANVLAVHVDGFVTSGWWYEGAGLFRSVRITRSSLLRVADDGLFSPTVSDAFLPSGALPSDGATANSTTLLPRLTVEHGGATGAPNVTFFAVFSLFDPSGALLGASAPVNGTLAPGAGPLTLAPPSGFAFRGLQAWSLARPFLYTLQASLSTDGEGDAVNVTLGVRTVSWTTTSGMALNGVPGVKLRGFCNHASFAGVGMGLPPRIHLARLQQLRGLGGNALRQSHNPAAPVDLALADALGVGVLDENRLFFDDDVDIRNMADMVRRDRQHASVLWWNFCNEGGCSAGTQPNLDFKAVTTELDGTRAVTANMFAEGPTGVEALPNATAILDVQGFSHGDRYDFAWFTKHWPAKPFAATECCSCESQRSEDSDLPKAPGVFWTSFASQPCTAEQSQASNGPADVAATFVWTLNDYFGEPEGWPHISSGFGQIDLAGFLKAPAFWYRSWWLSAQPPSDAARPPLTSATANTTVHLVETWAPPAPPHTTRTLHVYSSAPFVALLLNGSALAPKMPVPPFGWATFTVSWAPGNVSAVALSSDGATVLARHDRFSWGAPAAIVLTLDAPSATTGTGSALYLDGTDVGLLRATVVDYDGHPCMDSSVNITFEISEGPGLIVGCGNGDPASLHPNTVPWRPAYHGLSRAILRVTLDARGSDGERALRRSLEAEAGAGPRSSSILPPGGTAPAAITVVATAPGLLPSAPLIVPVSVDPAAAPLAVAAASVRAAWLED